MASYPGDSNNAPATGACGDTTEQLVVSKASASGTSTQALRDTVTVAGVSGVGTPTGTVTFTLWNSATNPTCDSNVGAPVHTSSGVALTAGVATSSVSGELANGTYYWMVTYSGDSKYNASTVEACGVQRATVTNDAS